MRILPIINHQHLKITIHLHSHHITHQLEIIRMKRKSFFSKTSFSYSNRQIPREYSQAWNQQQQQQSMSYKPNSKAPSYPQQAPYSIVAPQQYFLGTYPYAPQPVSSSKINKHELHSFQDLSSVHAS